MSIGIQAIQVYLPKTYVSQSDLEKFYGISEGKYTKGLGQHEMSFTFPHEDVNSMSLTVVNNLLKNNKISPSQIGRLQVGTESILDKSKSIKTILMSLFKGNHDIEGATSINACYGATNAIFNTLNWISSPSWDGRYGLVVAVDIAVYEQGPARPTGGAGAIAILITKNAKIAINPIRASYMDNQYDFYKPILNSEYPIVDGKLSQQCYLQALKECYIKLKEKLQAKNLIQSNDYVMFHCPYSKMVEKAFASLVKLENPNVSTQETEALFKNKVEQGLYIAKKVGNIYTGSLYSCLVSLLLRQPGIKNKKALMFSYGSGLCATLFEITIHENPQGTSQIQKLRVFFQRRIKIEPKAYTEVLLNRQKGLNKKGKIISPEEYIQQNTFYLDQIDEKYRRTYKFKAGKVVNMAKNQVSAMQRIQQIDKQISPGVDKFYKQTINQRHQIIQKELKMKLNVPALQSGGISSQQADSMIENVIGKLSLPLGLLPSIMINNKKYMVPMSIEEPSVIAASSSIAKFIAPYSFQTSSTPSVMIGQVYLSDVSISQINSILKRKQAIISELNSNCLSMVQRKGGVKDIRIRQISNKQDKFIKKYSMDILIDVCQAMGANIINTLAEKAKEIVSRMGIKTGISILSNYCVERKSMSQIIIPIEKMEWKGYSGQQVSKKIIQAYNFAREDVFRAVTHNKGIMNGIDAVCLATGQDWRAVQSAAHAYAAKNGRYEPLTHYEIITKENQRYFKGIIELPIAVGTVGGVLGRNQVYTNSLNILGNPSAQQLSEIIVTIGLAQNFAALRALAIQGIQKGHMRLHSRAIAMKYLVPSHLIEQCCRHMQEAKRYDQESVKRFIDFYSKPKL